jgi:hypothetical protein
MSLRYDTASCRKLTQLDLLLDLAATCAEPRCFRSGEIRVLDSTGKLEPTIAFGETDRKL